MLYWIKIFESARAILHGVDDQVDRARLLSDVIDQLDIDWQEDRRHVTDTAASYWVIHRLTSRLGFEDSSSLEYMGFSGTILMYVPEEEEHCFGAQILADGLSATGWKVDLNPDRAAVDVLNGVSSKYMDALGVSIGYDKNFIGLADMIQEARIVSKNPSLKVLLGGKAFEEPHSQYDFLGADVILKDVASTKQYLGRLNTSKLSDRLGRNA